MKARTDENYTTTEINKNFRIKVNGRVNGKYRSTLVGVHGLLQLLNGSWEALQEIIRKAYACMKDKFEKKLYRGPKITLYVK